MQVKTIVGGWSSEGPDLYFCIVDCTTNQYGNGQHYITAQEAAKEYGFDEPMVAFDEHDPPKAMFDLFGKALQLLNVMKKDIKMREFQFKVWNYDEWLVRIVQAKSKKKAIEIFSKKYPWLSKANILSGVSKSNEKTS